MAKEQLLKDQLRSPLEVIRNSAELLRSLCTDPRQLQATDTISRQVVSLTHMLDAAAGGPIAVDPTGEMPFMASRRILVVDDNPDIVHCIADALLSAGHSVATAASGELAVETALTFMPDVVVLDIGLPGMGGFEVAKTLRQNRTTQAATLIAMTGYGIRQFQNSEAHSYFDHCLLKPTGPLALLALIERTDRMPVFR
jgi:two-component system CheB/CheR fusion protein